MGIENGSLHRTEDPGDEFGLRPIIGDGGQIIAYGITTTREPRSYTTPFEEGQLLGGSSTTEVVNLTPEDVPGPEIWDGNGEQVDGEQE